MNSPSCSVPAAAAGFLSPFKLFGLCHSRRYGLLRFEALRVLFFRFSSVGHRGRYDHVLARLPVQPASPTGVFGVQLQ